MADLPVLDLEQRRELFGAGWPDATLAQLELTFTFEDSTLWLTWRQPGRLNSGGFLVNRALALRLGLVED